jgi:N-acetylmuramoyl-L-alanine amidase
MRRLAIALMTLVLVSACASPQVPPSAPTADAAAATAGSVAGGGETVPAFDPAPMRVVPNLAVKTLRATKLYTGPGPWYLLVTELPAGAAVTYLGNRDGWLQVRTSDGENAWLAVTDAELADGRGQAVTYSVKSGRWQVSLARGVALEVVRVGTGVMRLTATGLTGPAEVIPAGEDAVAIQTALPEGIQVGGDIGDSGIGRVSLTEKGILLDLERQPLYQVIENGGGRLVLEVRPGLVALDSAGSEGWRVGYRGDLRPVMRQEGGELVLDLPGALRGPGVKLPPGMSLQEVGPEPGAQTQSPTATNAVPPARMPAGGLRLRFPAPEGPYALYRPATGRLDLRFLSPGLAGKTIVVDPGHGGEETGAAGPAGNIEKEINLAVALRLKPLLEQAGAKVLMTRSEDKRVLPPERGAQATSAVERTQLDLAARSAISNEAGADLYVSIHANGGPPGDGGTEVYWASSNLNALLSRRLAEIAQEELLDALGLADRGFKQRPFNVIRMSEAPAMLVEMGFMTDPGEEALLASGPGQQAAAEAVFRAIARYFDEF